MRPRGHKAGCRCFACNPGKRAGNPRRRRGRVRLCGACGQRHGLKDRDCDVYLDEVATRTADRRAGSARFVCSGRGAGRTVDCRFKTDDKRKADAHFERYDHDVDDRSSWPRRRVLTIRKSNPRAGSTPRGGRAVLIYPEGRLTGSWYGRHRNGGLYKHKFSHQHAAIYGLPDGAIIVKARDGRLWRNFER